MHATVGVCSGEWWVEHEVGWGLFCLFQTVQAVAGGQLVGSDGPLGQ